MTDSIQKRTGIFRPNTIAPPISPVTECVIIVGKKKTPTDKYSSFISFSQVNTSPQILSLSHQSSKGSYPTMAISPIVVQPEIDSDSTMPSAEDFPLLFQAVAGESSLLTF